MQIRVAGPYRVTKRSANLFPRSLLIDAEMGEHRTFVCRASHQHTT